VHGAWCASSSRACSGAGQDFLGDLCARNQENEDINILLKELQCEGTTLVGAGVEKANHLFVVP